ncbi:MAG: response regulator [Acidobacteriota bacterium]
MRKLRILHVEDEQEWRDLVLLVLEKKEYSAQAASSLQDAQTLLENELFHLLIIDMHLDDQQKDAIAGLRLLDQLIDEGARSAYGAIILTGYPTLETQRRAFKEQMVLDFLKKRAFSPKTFATAIADLVPELEINLDLKIHWGPKLRDPANAVRGLRLGPGRIDRSGESELGDRAGEELDDLLCRLFHEASEVVLEPLGDGRSNTQVLLAQPSYPQRGTGSPIVVKFGDARDIEDEAERYEKWVGKFIGGGRSTQIKARRRTPLLGGLCYSLVGSGGESFTSLGEALRRGTLDRRRQILENLFSSTCANWYSNCTREMIDLTEEYPENLRFSKGSMREAFEKSRAMIQGSETLKLQRLKVDRAFSNPLDLLDLSLTFDTFRCTTHGDLNGDNVAVDDGGSTWLIDFQRTGPGHVLRDFAQLDAALRLRLLLPAEATLEERLALEEALLECDRFAELSELRLESDNPRLSDTFELCLFIRSLAGKQLASKVRDDFREYQAASFFHSINFVRFFDNSRALREHAFLSAALVAGKLMG